MSKRSIGYQSIRKVVILILMVVVGAMAVIPNATSGVTAASYDVLPRIRGGSRTTSPNQSGSKTYEYLLRGNTSKGFLPEVENLSKYGYRNHGWDINTPGRERVNGSNGGAVMSHTVFPSKTEIYEKNGEPYLRVNGTAVIPQYFHMTSQNHQVGIVTQENNKRGTEKMWRARLYNLPASSTFQFGHAVIDGKSSIISSMNHGRNIGTEDIYSVSNPYPDRVEVVNGGRTWGYFDQGYHSLMKHSALNDGQVSKLCGLGKVGSHITGQSGCNYVMDYTGFEVDIPVKEIIKDPSQIQRVKFKIAVTMTTPKGYKERVFAQNLEIPGLTEKTGTTYDSGEGYKGKIQIGSDITKAVFSPPATALILHKWESNFTVNEFNVDKSPMSNVGNASWTGWGFGRDTSIIGNMTNFRADNKRLFKGSKSSPKFAARRRHNFRVSDHNRINSRSIKANTDVSEYTRDGNATVMFGWDLGRAGYPAYTNATLAYENMPTAEMVYTPQGRSKPVIVRHRMVGLKDRYGKAEFDNGDYDNPKAIFSQKLHAVDKKGKDLAVRPLTKAELGKYGNITYLGAMQESISTSTGVLERANGMLYSAWDLHTAKYNGDEALVIDLYYAGTETPPPVAEEVGDDYTVRYVNKNDKEIARRDTGTIMPGMKRLLEPKKDIYGYEYARRLYYKGYKNLDNLLIEKPRLSDREISEGKKYTKGNHNVWFYYDYIEIPYEIEYRNIETDRKITNTTKGSVNVDNPFTASYKDVEGYKYTGEYLDVRGNRRRGNSVRLEYDGVSKSFKVVFYYEWEEPDNTHKDFDEYDVMDSYTNAGLVTKRKDSEDPISGHKDEEFGEDVEETRVNANTTAILDKYKAPIAIEPVRTTLTVRESSGKTTSESVTGNRSQTVLNTDYLDSLNIRANVGYGQSNSSTRINLRGRNNYLDMETGSVDSLDKARREAIGTSGGTLNTTEESNYVGRWLGKDRTLYDLEEWTPTSRFSANVEHTLQENELGDVIPEFEYKVHNILKHNYVSNLYWDSEEEEYIEYYSYRDSELVEGYYDDAGRVVNSSITYKPNVSMDEVNINETLKAEDFAVNSNKVTTSRHLVAKEQFNSNGTKYTSHSSRTQSRSSGKDLVRADRTDRDKENYEVVEINYYEEFGYVPYANSDEDLMTQQAVPVGGKVLYINPYDYFVLPSAVVNTNALRGSAVDSNYDKGSVVDREDVRSKVESNVSKVRSDGVKTSEMNYNRSNSGFYSKEVDQFDEFSLEEDITEDKAFMENELGLTNGDNYNYKQSVRFDSGLSHMRLRDRVLVGRMTGYPVVIDAQEELDVIKGVSEANRGDEFIKRYADIYEGAFEREFGYKPTKYDKALSGNGSVTYYYLPLEKDNIKKSDVYETRLVVNGIGVSQFNLVEDHRFGFEKYLYGRGEDVIFSGQREPITSFEEEAGLGEDVKAEDQNTYKPQVIGQGKETKKTEQINGTRTRNNSEINKEILGE